MKVEQTIKTWVKPQLTTLGKLKDVAPGNPGTGEGNSGKS